MKKEKPLKKSKIQNINKIPEMVDEVIAVHPENADQIRKDNQQLIDKQGVTGLEPLGPNERYFEAPDGTILKGSKDTDKLWYRNGNNGEGMWINPKR